VRDPPGARNSAVARVLALGGPRVNDYPPELGVGRLLRIRL